MAQTIKQFAATLNLQDVVMVEPVQFEMYGTKRFVINGRKLSRLLLDAKFEGGYTELYAIMEERLLASMR